MSPTEFSQAYLSRGMLILDDEWYMSNTTSQMTHTSATLLPFFDLSTNNHILVGNGHRIPVTGFGHTILPNK